jgi:hypothetical protein
MAFLKQMATRDIGGSAPYATGRLIPATEPTGTAYVNWKAKFYGSYLGSATTFKTRANALERYNGAAMLRYHKILRRESKLGATAMAA